MSGAVLPTIPAPRRTGPPRRRVALSWSDPRFRAIVWQAVILGGLALLLATLVINTSRNLEARHIATGFGYLDRTAGIPVGEHLIGYDPATSTYGRALLIGFLNTLRIAVVGIVLATVLGTLVGLARLSRNWLLSRVAGVYVETLRDIPLLLQLLFWYGLVQTLPPPKQSFHPIPGVFLSNRGFRLPTIDWQPGYGLVLAALALAIGLAWAWARRAGRIQERTGVRPPVVPPALALLLGLPLLAWLAVGAPFSLDVPSLHGFNFAGGAALSPEYGALLTGLVLYTATYIAEIVRSGILAVPQGQWEAAEALGLRRATVLRRIVLPQALRVIIPPMTSQFLNLTKNSSLAVAIGYQDIVSIANTEINQTGQAIEGIAIIMAAYLSISLSISLFMNWYNRRIALVER
jgi:general L-amino acid transport system permease protein